MSTRKTEKWAHRQHKTHRVDHGFYSPDDTLSADATRYDVNVPLGYAKLRVAKNMTTIAASNVARFHRVRRHRITSLKATLSARLSFSLFLKAQTPSASRGGSRILTR